MKESSKEERLPDLFASIVACARLGASLSQTRITPDENWAIGKIKSLIEQKPNGSKDMKSRWSMRNKKFLWSAILCFGIAILILFLSFCKPRSCPPCPECPDIPKQNDPVT